MMARRMSRNASPLVEGLVFGEGPRWRDGRLWFSDMHDLQVKTVDLQGRVQSIVRVPGRPSGLGWLPDGRLLIVSMRDRKLLRLDPGGLVEAADLAGLASHDCNDMVVDARGRAYVGHFGGEHGPSLPPPPPADLILVPPGGEPRAVARDLAFPNGAVLSADGSTLIVAESFARRLTAFRIRPDGGLEQRRVWAELPEGAYPDGICLDAEGAVWVAATMQRAALRVREGGEVVDRVGVSGLAIACMLGGPDGRTLFVCSAESTDPAECVAKRSARIEIARVDAPHAGLP
jgi:sugar lactone lactonase YvrE